MKLINWKPSAELEEISARLNRLFWRIRTSARSGQDPGINVSVT